MTALPPLGARPRQARSLATRERYYEATIARFERDGVEAARVQDIVDDAGGSWGAYHHYFPRKEDALIEHFARHIRNSVRPLVDAALADPGASIRDAVEAVLVEVSASQLPLPLHGQAFKQALAHPDRLVAMLDGELPVAGLVALLLRAGQERGEVHTEADPFSLAAVLSGGTMFPVLQTAYGAPMRGLEGAAPGPGPSESVRRMFAIAWRAVAAEGR